MGLGPGSGDSEMDNFFKMDPETAEQLIPSNISVFAVEYLNTGANNGVLTEAGSGYTLVPDGKPNTPITTYRWQGRLFHPSTSDNNEEYVETFNVRSTLEELAKNLAKQTENHPNPTLQSAGKPSYTHDYDIPPELEKKLIAAGVKIRKLTPIEIQEFEATISLDKLLKPSPPAEN